MVYLGIDVLVLLIIGFACVVLVTVLYGMAGASKEEGDAAVIAAMLTSTIMIIGYVIMARTLDIMLL